MDNKGKYVTVHYRGLLINGHQFDSSYERGEPITYLCGDGQMIPGFDDAVAHMKVGEKKTVSIEAQDAYGDRDPAAVVVLPTTKMPNSKDLPVGKTIYIKSPQKTFQGKVVYVDDNKVILDTNHQLAGENLTFEIELIAVSDTNPIP